jgi:SAM-dependent methyltransferase
MAGNAMPGTSTASPAQDWAALVAAAGGEPLQLARIADRIAERIESLGDTAKGYELAAEALSQALRLAPQDPEIRTIAGELFSESVPAWHGTIVTDRARNQAYDAALRNAIEPGMRVLEVGTGTGILAMMAARAGAAEVITCEANPVIAQRARQIVAENGYADRVRVIGKHSNDLRLGVDLTEPADVFVSEIISGSLLNEAVLPVVQDVVPRLLKPDGIVIPFRGTIRVALAWYDGAPSMRLGTIEGFDLSAFNAVLAPHYSLQVEDTLLTKSSAAADLFAFTFQSGGPYPDNRAALTLRAKARANGVVQWIRIRADRDTYYENEPGTGEGSSWCAEFHPFLDGRTAEAGEDVVVHGSHGQTALRIWTAAS